MIFFLYGQDTYRLRQKLNEIIAQHKKASKAGLNLKYFDFSEDTHESLRDEIGSVSLFAGKKLLVLRNTFSNESFKDNLLKDGRKFLSSKDVILFYEKKEIPEKDKLFKFLKKNAKLQEFKPLGGEKLKTWAKNKFSIYKTEIEQQALEKLINFVGNDLWRLDNEIKKLICYKKNQKIELRDINFLVQPKIETDIFKAIDAIAARDKKKALTLIHQHLEKGDSPLYLLSMINFQFRNLLMVKSLKSSYSYPSSPPRGLKIHPYVFRKTVEQSKKFSLADLKKIYQKIFQLDLAIKTGKMNGETALDLLVPQI